MKSWCSCLLRFMTWMLKKKKGILYDASYSLHIVRIQSKNLEVSKKAEILPVEWCLHYSDSLAASCLVSQLREVRKRWTRCCQWTSDSAYWIHNQQLQRKKKGEKVNTWMSSFWSTGLGTYYKYILKDRDAKWQIFDDIYQLISHDSPYIFPVRWELTFLCLWCYIFA